MTFGYVDADWTICGSESRPACLNFFNIPDGTDTFYADVSNRDGDSESVGITFEEGSSKTLSANRLITFQLTRTYQGFKAELCGNSALLSCSKRHPKTLFIRYHYV